MKTVNVYIKRNSDGKIVKSRFEGWGGDIFYFSEGNFSCDCNRSLEFNRAIGDELEESNCGETAFSIKVEDSETGEPIYFEF